MSNSTDLVGRLAIVISILEKHGDMIAVAAVKDAVDQLADYEEVLADKRRLAREIDVAMHGVEGAAKQPSLCDLIEPAKQLQQRALASESKLREIEAETWTKAADFIEREYPDNANTNAFAAAIRSHASQGEKK